MYTSVPANAYWGCDQNANTLQFLLVGSCVAGMIRDDCGIERCEGSNAAITLLLMLGAIVVIILYAIDVARFMLKTTYFGRYFMFYVCV